MKTWWTSRSYRIQVEKDLSVDSDDGVPRVRRPLPSRGAFDAPEGVGHTNTRTEVLSKIEVFIRKVRVNASRFWP